MTSRAAAAAFLAVSTFATWMSAVMPANAQGPVKEPQNSGAPVGIPVVAPTIDPNVKYSEAQLKNFNTLKEAAKFAQANGGKNGIAVLVFKGTENESGLTGEKIGEMLAGRFKNELGVPAKAFVVQGEGKFSVVSYFTQETAYGPFALKSAVFGQPFVASDYKAALIAAQEVPNTPSRTK